MSAQKIQIKINENLILFYEDGELSCIEKPLDKVQINIYKSGTQYYKNGKQHRENGPAITNYGNKFWVIRGKYHRTDGPAIEWADGACEYWENGEFKKKGKVKNE